MAEQNNAAANAVANIYRTPELWAKITFTFLCMVIYRVGSHITAPGVDVQALTDYFTRQQGGGLLGLYDMFVGGGLSRATVFALGIMPYISASIFVQIAGAVLPNVDKMQKDEEGRKKLTQYTRYLTVVLALIQAYGFALFTSSLPAAVSRPGPWFTIQMMLFLATGAMFVMWLGEQITERGLGNGISILIFAGIAAGLPSALGGLMELVRTGAMSILVALVIVIVVGLVTYFVVFVERGQRKILVNYARRQVGNKVYGGQSSHLPLKLNMAGVIPPIFASSIILLPATVVGWFTTGDSMRWLKDIAATLTPGQPIYVMLYASAIIFFCFFYTALVFNSRETADNLKKSGAFVPGIRPGDQTARYIDKILVRLTLAGAVYITFVCLLPEFLILKYNVPFYFGGTSLLIIVVVTMDFMAQVQNYMMSQQYESLLKKANFKPGQ